MAKGIFVAASKQHVGKTTVSLSLMHKFKQKFQKVGFIKPVGQEHVIVGDKIKVDKDVNLFKNHFRLVDCNYKDMSPIVVDQLYTRKYIENIDYQKQTVSQIQKIKYCYQNLKSNHEFMVAEGTGHVGVGSVIGLSNAKIASLLNLDMLLVANGGIGNTIDTLELNKAMCDKENVNIKGVVINKVIPSKQEEISYYVSKYLKQYNIPVLGVVPFIGGIDEPTINDIMKWFQIKNLSQDNKEIYHVKKVKLVELTLSNFLKDLKNNDNENTLFVTHSSRSDILLGFCSFASIYQITKNKKWKSALMLCDDSACEDTIKDNINNCGAPIFSIPMTTTDAIIKIKSHTAKLNADDPARTEKAIEHYTKYINIEKLIS